MGLGSRHHGDHFLATLDSLIQKSLISYSFYWDIIV